jgi:hypothetical protein
MLQNVKDIISYKKIGHVSLTTNPGTKRYENFRFKANRNKLNLLQDKPANDRFLH